MHLQQPIQRNDIEINIAKEVQEIVIDSSFKDSPKDSIKSPQKTSNKKEKGNNQEEINRSSGKKSEIRQERKRDEIIKNGWRLY